MLGEMMVRLMPLMPPSLVRRVAGRYLAGESEEQAIILAGFFNQEGFLSTIDMLGEDVTEEAEADRTVDLYLALMELVVKAGITRNLSIKLSQLGLRIDAETAWERLVRLMERADRDGIFIRIDMEDSTLTDLTLDLYLRARERWPLVGTVLQSRLFRTVDDARRLAGSGGDFRLCKGIYPENGKIAHQDDRAICEAFKEILEILLAGGSYVGVATHDLDLLGECERIVARHDTAGDRHEYQALLGVPIRSTLERIRDRGEKVRLYLPYGADWLTYSLRRLQENPKIAAAIALSLLKRDRMDTGRYAGR
jgi:proline dehydrogenase